MVNAASLQTRMRSARRGTEPLHDRFATVKSSEFRLNFPEPDEVFI